LREGRDAVTSISALLVSPIGAVLVKGLPGSGKTIFALELLRRAGGGHYVSTRVSGDKLSQQIPTIKELVVTGGRDRGRARGVMDLKDLRLANPTQLIKYILEVTEQVRKEQLVVVDSWDAMAKEMSAAERLRTERTLVAITEGGRAKLVFVSEEPENTTLSYLADAVVELKRELHEGAVVRTLEMQKLRGSPIIRPTTLFSLVGARFTEFEASPTFESQLMKKGTFNPIKHSEQFYSTGVKQLDERLLGGFRKGSIPLLEFGPELPQRVALGIYNLAFSNFILNGGCVLSVPGEGASPPEVISLLKLTIPARAISKNLLIGAFEKYDNAQVFYLNPNSIKTTFESMWKSMASLKGRMRRPLIGTISVDIFESIFEGHELLHYLSRTIELVRRNRDVMALACGDSSVLKKRLSDLSDVHSKYEMINGTLVIHGLKPSGPFTQISYDYSRGYPYPVFTTVF
jgi:KaiC/GvpD/RAD55 family RecA-like ATPase